MTKNIFLAEVTFKNKLAQMVQAYKRTDQWTNKIQRFKVTGNAGRGRPPKSCKVIMRDDLKCQKLPVNMCQDHDGWRKNV